MVTLLVTLLHGSKWLISTWLRMPLISTDHSIEFPRPRGVEQRSWKLNGVLEQSKKVGVRARSRC
jgi:hypothetical protein